MPRILRIVITFIYHKLHTRTHIFLRLPARMPGTIYYLLYMQNGRASSQVMLSFIHKIITSFHFISTSSSTAMVSLDHPIVRLLDSRSSSSLSLISASPLKRRRYSLGISPLGFPIPKGILTVHLYSFVNRFILLQ